MGSRRGQVLRRSSGGAGGAGDRGHSPWLINAAGKLLEEAGEGSGGHPGDRADRPSPGGEQMAVSQSQQERLETPEKLLSALERAGMLEQVGSIDLTHSTWISMVYRERFEARIPWIRTWTTPLACWPWRWRTRSRPGASRPPGSWT